MNTFKQNALRVVGQILSKLDIDLLFQGHVGNIEYFVIFTLKAAIVTNKIWTPSIKELM